MPRPILGLICFAACATGVLAQPQGLPSPRMTNVFPAGAKAGATVEVAVTGSDLDEPQKLLFSHPGLRGEYLPPPPPDPKKMPSQDQRDKAASKGPHNFKVTVAKDVPPGLHDVRVASRWGVSNPRAFIVGSRPEVNEKEPNNDVPEAQRVDVGTTIHGTISANTDVDYTIFTAKKGQRIVLQAHASLVDGKARPLMEVYDGTGRKLAQNRNYDVNDAVTDVMIPVDGDYIVRLSEFAYAGGSADHIYRLTISTDPWIDAVYPPVVEPGKTTEVTLYGRNLPGSSTSEYTVDGRPLEKLLVKLTPPSNADATRKLTTRTKITPPEGVLDGFEYRLKGPSSESNAVMIYFAREKVQIRKGPMGLQPENALPLTLPVEMVGMVENRNDRHWYRIEGKKGDVLMIDLQAERIGTRADYFFSLHDATNQNRDLLGEIDDDIDALHMSNFATRTTDPPALRWTVPFDGKFNLQVAAREASTLTGPRTAYRLRVASPKPDFRAVVLPYSRYFPTGSAGWREGTEAFDVFVHRIDGYNEPIVVTAEGLPPGVTAKPLTIGPAARYGSLTLRIAKDAKEFTGHFQVKASAKVDGKTIVDLARPASLLWGTKDNPNLPLYCRLTDSLALAIRPEKSFFTVTADPSKATIKVNNKDEKAGTPLTIKQGDKATLPVIVRYLTEEKPGVTLTAEAQAPNNLQQNLLSVQPAGQPTKDKPEAAVTIDVRPTATPGSYTLVIKGTANVPFSKDTMGKNKTNVPATEFTDPIELRIVPVSLARISVGPLPNGSIKLGASAEVIVKVERQLDYSGEFKVAFTPPPEAKGVTAAEVVIPPGQNEAKLTIKVDPSAKPGSVNNATVKVTGLFEKNYPVLHETKLNFNIAK